MEDENINELVAHICERIPDDYEISIVMDNDAGWVHIWKTSGNDPREIEFNSDDMTIAEQIDKAICLVNELK